MFPSLQPSSQPSRRALLIDLGTSATCMALSTFAEPIPLRFEIESPTSETAAAIPLAQRYSTIASSAFERKLGQFYPDLMANYRYVYPDVPFTDGFTRVSSLKRGLEARARIADPATPWERDGVLDVAAFVILLLEKAVDDRDERVVGAHNRRPSIVYASVPNAFPPKAVSIFQAGIAAGVAAAFNLDHVPEVIVVPEGVAVAYQAESQFRIAQPIPSGPPEPFEDMVLLVIDAGAGTTDASVVRISDMGDKGKRVTVLGSAGLPIGGLDVDILMCDASGETEAGTTPTHNHLRQMREVKERAWKDLDFELDKRLSFANQNSDFKAKMKQKIDLGVERFLALAVDGLLSNLPGGQGITHYIISGRASHFENFEACVEQHPLLSHRPRRIPAVDNRRKELVIEGLATYARQGFGSSRANNLRSGFEVYLSRGGKSEELVPINTHLGEGYSVISWRETRLNTDEDDIRWLDLRLRLLANSTIGHFEARKAFSGIGLRAWCDFLLLRCPRDLGKNDYLVEIDHFGLAIAVQHNGSDYAGNRSDEVGEYRFHPVHNFSERLIAPL